MSNVQFVLWKFFNTFEANIMLVSRCGVHFKQWMLYDYFSQPHYPVISAYQTATIHLALAQIEQYQTEIKTDFSKAHVLKIDAFRNTKAGNITMRKAQRA